MKEATGELNMTVVTVVAIAAVAAFFYAFIWPSIKANLLAQTHCASAIQCTGDDPSKMQCKYYDDNMNVSSQTITCDMSSNLGNRTSGNGAASTNPKG